MSTTPPTQPIYSLLPAVYRSRDAILGGQLSALYQVLEGQYGIVQDNLMQLYADQFIETCAPWVIPYIGELIGYDPIYTVALGSPDSRAEVANTIGYRRRKGTLLAMEQLTRDVSGRTTFVVEEFRELITTLSLRDVRKHHNATANLRRGSDLQDQWGPFNELSRTIDVRRIAPRILTPPSPDTTPLDIAIHGPGRFNIPDIAIWIWRCHNRTIADAPAFVIGSGGYFFSSLGGPIPLFQQPPPAPQPFARLLNQGDIPEPISRWSFNAHMAHYYPGSLQLIADGHPVDISQIVCANLTQFESGGSCLVPPCKIAIDPELGRIQYASDLSLPKELRVNYNYGSPAEMAGGPYDRTENVTPPTSAAPPMVVGSAEYPTLESAVGGWNALPTGSSAIILLPNFECYSIDLTGPNAIQISAESQLLLASAAISTTGAPPIYDNSCVTLRGNIEVTGLPAPLLPDGDTPPLGQLQISGIWLAGQVQIGGDPCCVQIMDSTLVPGQSLTAQGNPASPGSPSVTGTATGATVCLTRVITGPMALPSNCIARIGASVVDAGALDSPAYAGSDLNSPGASLHIEDSTILGKVWAQAIWLASNTIFEARLAGGDSWKASVWANRLQVGCVRFCWLPWNSLTPRRYECLPPNAASQSALDPTFVTLRFNQPGYCLLSGDVPMAVWKGADNGSQMGVYLGIQETEAVTNVQIRSQEYLPANLERGVFLIPSERQWQREQENLVVVPQFPIDPRLINAPFNSPLNPKIDVRPAAHELVASPTAPIASAESVPEAEPKPAVPEPDETQHETLTSSETSLQAELEPQHPEVDETQPAPATSAEINAKEDPQPEPPKVDETPHAPGASTGTGPQPELSGSSETQ
jgi:hypothetical protein